MSAMSQLLLMNSFLVIKPAHLAVLLDLMEGSSDSMKETRQDGSA
jgi:hypothetical protein